jgi:outer membrane protein assembly factor BamB
MKNRMRFAAFIMATLAFSSVISIAAQDWPQWRGANRDGKVKGFTAPGSWPPEITLQWRDSLGTGDATPVLVKDKLYIFSRLGNKEAILCLDANSGAEKWRNEYEAPAVTGPGARHPGPRSTPAVSNGKIVALGASGILSCLDASTGKLLWRNDPFQGVVPMFFTSMSPMIVDQMCIAYLGGTEDGAIIAYDLGTGQEEWRWTDEGPDYGSPALLTLAGTKQVVTLTEKSIVGVNLSDGKLLWKLPFQPEGRAYNAATPVVQGNRVIFTGAGRGTKAVKIEKQGEGFIADELWTNGDLAVQFNSPVLKDGLLYGYSNMGSLFCLDALTGKTAWTDSIKHDRSGFAAILDAGPVIMALPSSSELLVFKPVKEEYLELAKIKIADSPTYAHPVVAGNRIYIRDEKTIALWIIK